MCFEGELCFEVIGLEGFLWKLWAAEGGAIERKVDARFEKAGADDLVFEGIEAVFFLAEGEGGEEKKASFSEVAIEIVPIGKAELIEEDASVVGVDPVGELVVVGGEKGGVGIGADLGEDAEIATQGSALLGEAFVIDESVLVDVSSKHLCP